MSSLILTTAFGYESWQADLFLRSIPDSFSGDIVVFCDRKIALSSVAGHCKVVTAESHPQFFQKKLNLNSSNNSRYLFYKNYLDQLQSPPEEILLCDLRDVVFQENPFHGLGDGLLHVAAEPIGLAECDTNSTWFSRIYGKEKLLEYGKHPVICSGTTFGRTEAISHYLEWMVKETMEFGPRHDVVPSKMIMDQAMHIMYCALHPGKICVETCESGVVATLAHHKSFLINTQGQLINQKGKPYSIVHQYDRFRPLRCLVKDVYGFKDQFDLEHTTRHFFSTSISSKLRKSLKAVYNVMTGMRR